MKHYLKNKEGDVKYTVDMYCGHPNMVGNSMASVSIANTVWRSYL